MRHLPLGEDVIMDPTLPAELLQSYVRLLFKAWDGQSLNSATLTMAELRALWGDQRGAISTSQAFLRLKMLRERYLIEYTTARDGCYRLKFPKAKADSENSELTLKNESQALADSEKPELTPRNKSKSSGDSEKSESRTTIGREPVPAEENGHADSEKPESGRSCSSSGFNKQQLLQSGNLPAPKTESVSQEELAKRLTDAICGAFNSPRPRALKAMQAALERGWSEDVILSELCQWKLFIGSPDSQGIKRPWLFVPVQIENGSLCPLRPAPFQPAASPAEAIAVVEESSSAPPPDPLIDVPWNGCGQSPRQIWEVARGQLQLELNKNVYDTWIRGVTVLRPEEGVFVLGATHAYAKDWLENRLLGTIKRTLSDVVGHSVEVRLALVNGSK